MIIIVKSGMLCLSVRGMYFNKQIVNSKCCKHDALKKLTEC